MQTQGHTSQTAERPLAFAAAAAAGYTVPHHPPASSKLHTKTRIQNRPDQVQQQIAAMETIESPMVWRVIEVLIAAVALILVSPLIALIAVLVKLDSPGPAFFRQPRVGRGGRLFRFTKFRTLYHDARQRFPHLYAYDYSPREIETLCFKVKEDPRVTRLGRFLRKSTLDELPNFWHVLTGEMSLVGPRPEIPEMLSYYDPRDLVKFLVRPGITGLAQVSGRGLLSFVDTVRLDVEYIRNRSAMYDISLMFRTLWCVVLRRGAF